MIRRFGQVPRSGQGYRLRPGAYAVLERDGRILLTHQAWPEPEYQLPGGGIERAEHPVPALHREVLEETGYTMAIRCRLGAFRRFTYMPEYDMWAEKLCTVYLARPAQRMGPPSEPGHRALWVPPAVALEVLGNAGDRHFLAQVIAAMR